MRSHKALAVGFWTSTALFALQMSFTAYAQLRVPQVAQAFAHLGFPAYFRIELSWAKFGGVIALLVPMVPARVKEWAYAGIFFDLTGASLSHLFANDPVAAIAPAVLLVLTMASWSLRPESRRLLGKEERETVSASGESAPHLSVTVG